MRRDLLGNNDLDELLTRVREVESNCISILSNSQRSTVNDEYTIHKTALFELYNSASLLLESLEKGASKNVLIEKLKIEDKILKMKMEIDVLRSLNQKKLTSIFGFKPKNEYVDKSDEVDIFEHEFITTVQSRLKKITSIHESERIQVTYLDEILSRNEHKKTHENDVGINKEKINDWIEINSKLDKEIRELGNSADRITDKANKLTKNSKLQNSKIEEIKVFAELTTGDVANLNRKVQEIIGTNNTTFCCRITLVVLVFISTSIIIALIFKKLI